MHEMSKSIYLEKYFKLSFAEFFTQHAKCLWINTYLYHLLIQQCKNINIFCTKFFSTSSISLVLRQGLFII